MRRPACKVVINGTDYTSRMAPLVESIKVSDKAGFASDTCKITLNDKDGQIALPSENDMLEVSLGDDIDGVGLAFQGKIDEVRSTGTVGGGRQVIVGAKSVNSVGKGKEVTEKHKDKAKFGDVAKEWGKDAGMTEVIIDIELENVEEDYWSMDNESFIAWAQRKADEMGATFKVQGDKAMFLAANGGTTARGKNIPDFEAKWGTNLKKWDISPVVGRSRHKNVEVEYYDSKDGKLKTKKVDVKDEGASATLKGKVRASDEKSAERAAKSGGKKVERKNGSGTISVVGSAKLKPEGKLILIGAREGIDGEYRITNVEHNYSTKSGYECDVTVEQPQGKAGKDSRRKAKSKTSSGSATTTRNNSATNTTGGGNTGVG